jgi:hypothetical protein
MTNVNFHQKRMRFFVENVGGEKTGKDWTLKGDFGNIYN